MRFAFAMTMAVAGSALLVGGCDDDKAAATKGAAQEAASAAAAASASATAAATATATASAPPIPMPPRPVPIGSSGPIQPSAPPEQQVMAIQYTLAMVTPRANDPLVDKEYLDDMIKKLEVAVRTADKGKTPPNPVSAEKGNRKIKVEMGKGCTDKVPSNLVAQRAGSSLRQVFEAGILVVSCHDDRWECHQSTRDPADVLCHAAPRH
jgi:hypothetical protein